MWIYHLFKEVGLKLILLAKIWCDNQIALHTTLNSEYHIRNIKVDCHFVREDLISANMQRTISKFIH